MARNPAVMGYLTATVADTAGTLIGLASATIPTGAKSFVGKLETAQVRARGDGTSPSTTEGEVIEIGQVIYLSESEFEKMKFIRTGSTSGVIKGHFYNVELDVLLGKNG